VKVQPSTVGLALSRFRIPPPTPLVALAELPSKVQLVTVGLLPAKLNMPPPAKSTATLPLNVQSVTAGLLPVWLYMPPPCRWAMLASNVQLVTVGLPAKVHMPAPRTHSRLPGSGPLA
jgi:hypothetical protein